MARTGSYAKLARAVLAAMQTEAWEYAKSVESDPFFEIETAMRELGYVDAASQPIKKSRKRKDHGSGKA
jgi:hypothetical protein